MAGKMMKQITVKMNPEDAVSRTFFSCVENRDRQIYPTIFSYLNAAVTALELSGSGNREESILTETDLELIEMTVLDALRIYERKKKEERMVP